MLSLDEFKAKVITTKEEFVQRGLLAFSQGTIRKNMDPHLRETFEHIYDAGIEFEYKRYLAETELRKTIMEI